MITPRRRAEVAPRAARGQPSQTRHRAAADVCLGRLVGADQRGALVEYDGVRAPVPARLTTAIGRATLAREVAARREVVLLVDRDTRRAPVILGFLQPVGEQAAEVEARIDGQRVELEARDEIVLKCGEASITLRRNGRISIRGVDVESRARGSNRIKGGSVAIN